MGPFIGVVLVAQGTGKGKFTEKHGKTYIKGMEKVGIS